MSGFFVDVWESIFTPGPTAPLLKATNITFAALQATLLALLFATYSVHCVVLSVLCAGLWWSINWFAAELTAVRAEEEAKKKKEEEEEQEEENKKQTGERVTPGEGGSDTEVEGGDSKPTGAATSEVEPVEKLGDLKKRGGPASQSSASTEDEWEKVSENEKEKDK